MKGNLDTILIILTFAIIFSIIATHREDITLIEQRLQILEE